MPKFHVTGATVCVAMLAPILASAGSASAGSASAGSASAGSASAGSAAAPGTPAVAPAATRTLVVTNRGNAGPGSLRAAIRTADAAQRDTSTVIDFAVHGVIGLASALPAITRTVTIDGRSAPGYASGGPPVVEIDCRRHGGLWFAAGSGGSQLLALAVDNAGGNGVTLGAGFITLNLDYIGLSLAGHAFGNRGAGVFAGPWSAGNSIGLNTSGASGAVGNVISANRGSGVVLSGSSGNTVVANRIGTNPAGTSGIGNRGDGIVITRWAAHNEIGGTDFVDSATGQANNPTGSKGTVTPVFVVPPLGNLISGNGRNGVLIGQGSRKNVLNGNFIGTTAGGDGALGNGGNGVWIDRAGGNSLVGCTFVNNPFVYYNVVSGNRRNGLRITDSPNATVQGNFFGIGANNTTIVRNRRDGVLVDGDSVNTQVGGVIPLGNVSAGNGRNGIEVTGRVRGFVTFNTFGGLLAFKGAAPNGRDGLLITSTGGDNLARTNVFSGNAKNGIELAGNAWGVTVDPDIVGLNTKGNAPLPNGGDGVLIDQNAHANVIGGSLRSVIPQNTFSGNMGYGLAIIGNAHGNVVFSSFVGPLILGVKPAPNHRGGILLAGTAHHNAIGTPGQIPANLISANIGNGVTLLTRTFRNLVISNFIGLDRFGKPLPNTGHPVVDEGCFNVIRGNRYPPGQTAVHVPCHG